MKLIRFDWNNNLENLNKKTDIKNVINNVMYGYGIYTF
jgi:hypothetical protein